MVRINLRGTFVVGREATGRVRPGSAIIKYRIDGAEDRPSPNYTAYAATKGAVDAITLILAKEMEVVDVTVNSVAPRPQPRLCFSREKARRPWIA